LRQPLDPHYEGFDMAPYSPAGEQPPNIVGDRDSILFDVAGRFARYPQSICQISGVLTEPTF
jgi:hypothetical protein